MPGSIFKCLLMVMALPTNVAVADDLRVYIIQSFMWEGRPLSNNNLKALHEFRSQVKNQPISHFVSSSYFARGKDKADANLKLIREHIAEHDLVGLNLTAWRSEVEGAGLIFRHSPTFFGHELNPARCQDDCGQEIPASAYPSPELHTLLETAKRRLSVLSTEVDALHVQGWIATPNLLSNARALGFMSDYSGVATEIIRAKLYHFPIFSWVEASWQQKPSIQQPYALLTKNGSIVEVGNFMASIDYLTAQQVLSEFKKLVSTAKSLARDRVIFHLSLRVESAFDRVNSLIDAHERIKKHSKTQAITLIPHAVKFPGQLLQKRQMRAVRDQGAH